MQACAAYWGADGVGQLGPPSRCAWPQIWPEFAFRSSGLDTSATGTVHAGIRISDRRRRYSSKFEPCETKAEEGRGQLRPVGPPSGSLRESWLNRLRLWRGSRREPLEPKWLGPKCLRSAEGMHASAVARMRGLKDVEETRWRSAACGARRPEQPKSNCTGANTHPSGSKAHACVESLPAPPSTFRTRPTQEMRRWRRRRLQPEKVRAATPLRRLAIRPPPRELPCWFHTRRPPSHVSLAPLSPAECTSSISLARELSHRSTLAIPGELAVGCMWRKLGFKSHAKRIPATETNHECFLSGATSV